MAEPTTPEPVGNDRLQLALLEQINSAQQLDPLAPVTLLVDTAAQGWALRRQLVARLPADAALANVRCLTIAGFMHHCARAWRIPTSESLDETVRVAVTEATLRAETGLMAASAGHADTAVRLAGLVDELAWCPLTETDLRGLASTEASTTSQAAADVVARVRSALTATLQEQTWPDVAARTCALAGTGPLPESVRALGTIIVAAARVPRPARELLALLERHLAVAEVRPRQPTPDQSAAALVLDCPDPSTEVALAVRHVVAAIDAGDAPARIAVLFPVGTPYRHLLAAALDDAGLTWHGPGQVSPQATSIGRLAACIAEMTAARSATSSGITRPLLMRWLNLGHLHEDETRLNTAPMRAIIRAEGLFGDARGWRGALDAMAELAPAQPDDPDCDAGAGTDSDSTEADDADLARQDRERRGRERRAGDAAALAHLIERLDASLASIATATTWSALGARLWEAIMRFHLPRAEAVPAWWQVAESERIAHETVRRVLTDSLPALDRILTQPTGGDAGPAVADVILMLARALAAHGVRHGTGSVGIHVGSVSSARGLVFDTVIVVGAAEGLLPVVSGADPLLPDEVRLALRRHPDDLPTSSEHLNATRADLLGVCAAARTCVVTYPRGAIPGRGVDLPSRYVTATDEVRVRSARASLRMEPAPVTSADLVLRASLAEPCAPEELAQVVDAVAAWSRPTFDRHFGRVGTVDGERVWDLGESVLSASGIEAYLHCPYHFFVRRVLGIDTDEYADEVDQMSPADLGTMLHRVLERLVAESAADGSLPEFGQPWPAQTLGVLQRLLDEEAAEATARGLTGWRPAWEHSYRQIIAALPDLLAKDAVAVRGNPPTRPLATERRFGPDEGLGDGPVEIRLTDDVWVRLRGSIDRVDVDETGQRIGIVDYKSGSAEKFKSMLGAPGARGAVNERTKVQDLVYDAAARVLYPEATEVGVRFVFVPNKGQGVEVVEADHEPDRATRLVEILRCLYDAGSTGQFPPEPRGSYDFCPVCARLGRTAKRVAGQTDLEEEEQ